jgi:hypothetical protein
MVAFTVGKVVVGLQKDCQIVLWNVMNNSVCYIACPCDGVEKDIAKGEDINMFAADSADKILLLRGWREVYLWYKPQKAITGVWSEILPGETDIPLCESPNTADAAFYCNLVCVRSSYVFMISVCWAYKSVDTQGILEVLILIFSCF